MGNLVFQATLGGQVNLVGPNTASTFNLNVPAVSSTISTTSGTETLTNKTLTTPVINGFTGDTSVVNIGSGQFYKDTSGNIGVGVTPSAWSSFKALDFAGSNAVAGFTGSTPGGTALITNAFFDGAWKYKSTGAASNFTSDVGQFTWRIAGSGSANASLTWTQAMTLDASGRLGVNRTSPGAQFDVLGAASVSAMRIVGNSGASIYVDLSGGGDNYYDATNHIFRNASGTERARIDSSGNFLLSRTNTTASTRGSYFNSVGALVSGTPNGTALAYFQCTSNSADVGSITVSTTATAYNTSSDYRLKNITGPITGAKEFILALQPKKGTWKTDGSPFVGFVAHEFQEVSPSSVHGEKDAVDESGNPIYQGMQASSPEVMANLVSYIHELEARLAAAGI